ncbi:MAG TPA: helix-turn-helix domain-containing protein, partial [Pirellulales bacterium]|nr:helix-turn-helix domain-containing protein [Pirellulales bacterium]
MSQELRLLALRLHEKHGLGATEIAQRTTLSRSTVRRLLSGERPGERRVVALLGIDPPPVLEADETLLERPIHCPGCTKTIQIAPCRVCRARRAAASLVPRQPEAAA